MDLPIPEFLTAAGNSPHPNEDAVVVAPGLAVVTDGAGVPKRYRSGCRHEVTWYSHRLAAAFAELLADPAVSMRQGLVSAIAQVRDLHDETCDLAAGSPSATVAAFRVHQDRVEYLVQCDAAIGIVRREGSAELVTDRLIERVGPMKATRHQGLLAAGLAPDAAALAANDWIESLRNQPGGFWIPQADPAVAQHAITGTLSIAEVAAIVAMSDGITRAVERLGLHTEASLVEALATGPSTEVVADIRAAEADGTQRPGKQHDDVAVAVLQFD